MLECDRATIYSQDPETNELWSKAALGSKTIFRIPIGQGIAGICAENNRVINIANADEDERFNKDYDKKTGYHSKTILAMPIRN